MVFVFTSYGEGSCMITVAECAYTLYCAYHGYYTNASGQAVIYASMPYAGTDPSGCGAPASPNNDADADSTIHDQRDEPRAHGGGDRSRAQCVV